MSHLEALVVNAPAQIRDQLRRDAVELQVERCARLRVTPSTASNTRDRRALRATARRIVLSAEADDLEAELELMVAARAPECSPSLAWA